MEVAFTTSFIKMMEALPNHLQEEAIDKIELFQDISNHNQLKVHKLTGRLKGRYSFSVNYQIRIIFAYFSEKPKKALLHSIGDHDVYDR